MHHSHQGPIVFTTEHTHSSSVPMVTSRPDHLVWSQPSAALTAVLAKTFSQEG
jgi:hypothetical protein